MGCDVLVVGLCELVFDWWLDILEVDTIPVNEYGEFFKFFICYFEFLRIFFWSLLLFFILSFLLFFIYESCGVPSNTYYLL